MATPIQGRVVEKKLWTPRLVSLRFEADVQPFKAGQFLRVALELGGDLVGRPYSFVNSPEEWPHEIYFNIVEQGQLSPRLAALEPGDALWVNPVANGFLTLDEIPEVRHLWLLATGTGIGPFLSMLKTDGPWRRFDKIVLGHNVREARELTYQDSIDHLLQRHGEQLSYTPLVSREHVTYTLHGRIPINILNGNLEQHAGIKISPADSHVMLCGNSGMIEQTVELLAERGMKRHRRREHGHISSEQYF
ncbi:ferredoxin--NADP reductase [Candidatus Tenderia electrophaga]|uniref:ferredoxin--NADP(+) reductase n=1 Tax=Candidatus Tenderia electrophaga TaxID=1748243 RepID=A0A0S2TFG1_9GAMM|nr:ferredoxin--NADP reductase [Candidatus Tenderia electrophaga]